MRDEKVYSIGQMARLCDISVQTLRYYDKIGLVKATKRDVQNKYRYYGEEQFRRLLLVKNLRQLDFSLQSIARVLREGDVRALHREIAEKITDLEQEILTTQLRLKTAFKSATQIINALELVRLPSENDAERVIEVCAFPAYKVVSNRHISRYDVKTLFLDRHAEVQKLRDSCKLHSTGPIMAIFHDGGIGQFQGQECDLEVCLPIQDNGSRDHSCVRILEAVTCVTTVFTGPYCDMLPAYSALKDWASMHDITLAGAAIEYYLIDPTMTDSEENYVTRIALPIENKNVEKNLYVLSSLSSKLRSTNPSPTDSSIRTVCSKQR